MENITIGQIAGAIATIMIIVGFVTAILKLYKSCISDKFIVINKRLDDLEEASMIQEKDIKESKEERLILINGVLACLKGMQEQGLNGPVTKGINDIEQYLIRKSHE